MTRERIAILADIHSNLEALEAVIVNIKDRGIYEIYCLGDVVGYGPNPKECIDLAIKKFKFCLLGDHDEAALFESEAEFLDKDAKGALGWTRGELEDERDKVNNEKRWEYIGEMPRTYKPDNLFFVHGSPRNPVREEINPNIVRKVRQLNDIFSRFGKLCFNAHTHIPGVFTEDLKYLSPEQFDSVYELDRKKAIINVGSVGQPRDGKNEACYVIYDKKGEIEFVRIEYDLYRTMEKIYAIPQLDRDLAARLAEGR